MEHINKRKWWKESVIYQIYPRSFMDSNGDGVGDLGGIIQKLDYIKSLGVDMVWLNPVYKSPNDDNGYDISDYYNIMDEFGSMDDFDIMLEGMHDRGIRLIMDLVVNHSSDEHEWFQKSRSSRDNPYRDYYYWWPAEDGLPPYRWSYFDEKADAWQYDGKTDSYYLHYFSAKQPDLNWENEEVRKEIYNLMKFWFEKGVDGFRMDVISFISKELPFRELNSKEIESRYGNWPSYYARGPKLHAFLQEMNREVLSKYDIMTVGECPGVRLEDALDFVDEDRRELNTFFHFDGMDLDRDPKDWTMPRTGGYCLKEFKAVYSDWDTIFSEGGWGSIYLGNHDQSRIVSRWADDSTEYWLYSAKLLHTFLLSMRATPYIYYGDEIGMTNIRFDRIEEYDDLWTINHYNLLMKKGFTEKAKAYLEGQKLLSRDNGRTPMQWNATKNAGFSEYIPWLQVNPNYEKVNVEYQEKDENSILNYFRKMIRLRKSESTLVYGKYTLLMPEDEKLFAYSRVDENADLLVLLNFSRDEIEYESLPGQSLHTILINNYDHLNLENSKVKLMPWQAVIMKLER